MQIDLLIKRKHITILILMSAYIVVLFHIISIGLSAMSLGLSTVYCKELSIVNIFSLYEVNH